MSNLSQEEFEKQIAKQLAQSHLISRCIIRALVQTPGFDGRSFVDALAKEESAMTDHAGGAKDSLKSFIAEVEGYL